MASENQYTTDYSYSEVLSRIRVLSSEIDRSPTTREADEDERLPALDTIYRIAGKGWNEILEDADAGTTQVERYTDDERSHMVQDLQRVFSLRPTEELTSREYREKGRYATSTIKKHFGSWAEACEEANIACGSRHGNPCPDPKGESLDSRHAQRIAFFLHSSEVEYLVHEPIPGTDWLSDFYLPDEALWVEVDGYPEGTRPNEESFERKLSFYESQGLDYTVVTNPSDLKNRLFT